MTVRAQTRDKPNMWRYALENITAETAFHLLHVPVFLLSAGGQVQDGLERTQRPVAMAKVTCHASSAKLVSY